MWDFDLFFFTKTLLCHLLGGFARVELATHVLVKAPVALKITPRDELKDPFVAMNIEREYRILSTLNHPNIIKLLEVCCADSLYCLVFEYVAGSQTLLDVIGSCGALDESLARRLSRQIISALRYLHFKNILHRDLKMDNVLVDQDKWQCKLIDFGLSAFWYPGQEMKTFCGSSEYAAPELFMKDSKYGPAIDTWSFGVMLFAMTTGHFPFKGEDTQKLIENIYQGLSHSQYQEMVKISFDCQNLITKCFNLDFKNRIIAKDIAVDKWIVGEEEDPVALVEEYIPQEVLHDIANDVKSMLGIQKSTGTILELVSKHPFRRSGGLFNILKVQHLELMKKNNDKNLWPNNPSPLRRDSISGTKNAGPRSNSSGTVLKQP